MLNELEFKAFLQKELNRTPDDDQMAVLREIARVAESNEALNYFRIGASAGSGKTTLILFAYFLLAIFTIYPNACSVNSFFRTPVRVIILTIKEH